MLHKNHFLCSILDGFGWLCLLFGIKDDYYNTITYKICVLMGFRQLRFTSRYISLMAILLVVMAGLFSSQYLYKIMHQLSQREATLLLHEALVERAILIQAANTKDQTVFKANVESAVKRDESVESLHIVISEIPLKNHILLPEKTVVSAMSRHHWKELLIRHRTLTVSTYLPAQKVWLNMVINYEVSELWYDAAVILVTIFLVFILLLIGFVLYYRHMLAHELLYSIKENKHRDETKSPSLISHLRQQIKNYYEEKNIMITALAHDIKTPLTEAMLRLELLDDTTITAPVQESLAKINSIVKSSLEYAEQPDKPKKATVEIVSLVENIIDSYQEDVDILLIKKVASCETKVEVALFKRLVSNLIENAKKYATSCEFLLSVEEDAVVMICQDDGPGVPEAFIKLLAIPYFRVDQARTSDTGGSGLGLAIVNKIVELHDGQITFENRQGGGFRAKVIMPIVH